MTQTHHQRRASDIYGPLASGFYLNEVIVLPASNEIILFGKRTHLPPKPMQVLLYLAAHPDKVVSAEELLREVWKDDTQFKREGAKSRSSHAKVSHAISELRNTLDDHKDYPEFIQTRPRQGYQLVAEVKPLDTHVHYSTQWPVRNPINQQTNPNKISRPSATMGETHWHFSWALLKSSKLFSVSIAFVITTWALIQVFEVLFPIFGVPDWGMKLALLLIVVGFPMVLLYTWLKEIKVRKHLFTRKNGGRRKSFFFRQLAVDFAFIGLLSVMVGYLAFYLLDSIENDQIEQQEVAQQTFQAEVDPWSIAILPFKAMGEGVPDYFSSTLHSELDSSLSNNKVFKLISGYAIQDLNSDSPQLLRQRLGVQYLLDGRVSTIDKNISIVITLINTESLQQLWAITITDPDNSLLNLQKKLVAQISNGLELVSNQKLSGPNLSVDTNDVKAYDLYIQAKQKMAAAKSVDDYQRAEQLLLSSLSLDPNFTQASAALCQTSLEKYELGKELPLFDQAQQNCLNVLNLTPTDPESLVAMGHLLRIKGDYQAAQDFLDQALSNAPNYIPAIRAKAMVNEKLNRVELAESQYRQVLTLEPGYWKHYSDLGDFQFAQGDYQAAATQYVTVTLLKPGNEQAFNRLGASYYLANKFSQASAAWKKSLSLDPSANNYSNLGTAYFFNHEFSKARDNYQKALELNQADSVLWGNYADAEKYSGDHGSARGAYFKALELVNEQLSVNASDYSLLAARARYQSEVGRCDQFAENIEQIRQHAGSDPYIFYDLSISAKNCKNQKLARNLIARAIALGYSEQLLAQDVQFIELLPLPPTTERTTR